MDKHSTAGRPKNAIVLPQAIRKATRFILLPAPGVPQSLNEYTEVRRGDEKMLFSAQGTRPVILALEVS